MIDNSTTKIFGDEWTLEQFGLFMRPFVKEMFRAHGSRVLAGPFKGMEIPSVSHWDSWAQGAKLLGIYETELHGVIEKAIERRPASVINVGCAEGYYAIGMKGCLPDAQVYAVDMSSDSIMLCAEYATKNATLITVSTGRDWQKKYASMPAPRLMIMDIEGDEFTMDVPPSFYQGDFIIEVHGWLGKGTWQDLAARFSPTHKLEFIAPNPRLMFELWCRWPGNINQSCMLLDQRPPEACWLAGWANERG